MGDKSFARPGAYVEKGMHLFWADGGTQCAQFIRIVEASNGKDGWKEIVTIVSVLFILKLARCFDWTNAQHGIRCPNRHEENEQKARRPRMSESGARVMCTILRSLNAGCLCQYVALSLCLSGRLSVRRVVCLGPWEDLFGHERKDSACGISRDEQSTYVCRTTRAVTQ